MEGEAEIDRMPIDLLAHIFVLITSFTDLAQASGVCRKWKQAVKQSLGRRESLSFAGWKMDDDSTSRLLRSAYSLNELDISRSRWGCQVTDTGLYRISMAKCVSNLTSISLNVYCHPVELPSCNRETGLFVLVKILPQA